MVANPPDFMILKKNKKNCMISSESILNSSNLTVGNLEIQFLVVGSVGSANTSSNSFQFHITILEKRIADFGGKK